MVMRIGFTGAPFAGKTETSRSLAAISKIIVVPEAASLLYSCGFPKAEEVGMPYRRWLKELRDSFVPARVAMQIALEDGLAIKAQRLRYRALVCDRTVGDQAIYYQSVDEFLERSSLTRQSLYARYDHVLFFESLVMRPQLLRGYNRQMPAAMSRRAHGVLLKVFRDHPGFHYIDPEVDLSAKVSNAIGVLRTILGNGESNGFARH